MTQMLTDLASIARDAGLEVVEVPGWQTRGHGHMDDIQSIVCHHTAGPATGNYPSLNVVRDGRSDLPGPLAHYGLGRDGTVYVIAAGLAYHAGVVTSANYANNHAIGIEAEGTGYAPWPAKQMDAYAALCAALCDHYAMPVSRVLGHKEVCSPRGRKTDPNFDMDRFREQVAAVKEDDMNADDKAQLDRIEAKLDDLDKVLKRITKAKREVIAAVEDDK